jgi:hypothetical protein
VANGEWGFTFKTGQQINYCTRAGGSGRGLTIDDLVLDEIQHITDEELESLTSIILTKPYGQTVMTGSAPIPGRSHALSRMVESGRGGNPALTYLEWSCDENQPFDLDDKSLWAQANPGYNIRLFDQAFISDRVKLTPEGWAREHLGIVEVAASGVFPLGAWSDAADKRSKITGQLAFAVDVYRHPDQTFASISVAGLRSDGLIHVEVIEQRQNTDWIPGRLRELDLEHAPVGIILDEGGPAGSLIGDIEKTGLTVTKMTMRQVANATGSFYDGVIQGSVKHKGQPQLDAAAYGAVKRPLVDAWAWGRQKSSVDITPLVAATLAHWGLSEHLDGGGLAPDDVYVGKF